MLKNSSVSYQETKYSLTRTFGALILARLVQPVSESLPMLNGTSLWTDSMTILHWISNKKVWRQYVQHQLNEIRESTDASDWRYFPEVLNPADFLQEA